MRRILIALALLAPGAAVASCGSAFCTVNTDWDVQDAWTEHGARLDLRYEYIRQDRLTSGGNPVAVGQFARDHSELRSINQNLLAGIDYSLNHDWAVNVQAPFVRREHRHIETASGDLETWKFDEIGDMRVIARRRLATLEDSRPSIGTFGANFGLKLPTGRTDVVNGDGERAERTLQPGSGTTDLLAGLFYSRQLPVQSLSWFVQGMVQIPLLPGSGYRPGNRYSLDAGMRRGMGDFGLMLQANLLLRGRDGGGEAESEDTGGQFLFLSPGVSYALTKATQVYGFLQLPLYQYVNGVQLTSQYAVSLGVSSRF